MHPTPASKDNTTRLAFDCSVVGVSVALRHEGRVYARRDYSGNKQAGQLLPMIEAVLAEACVGYKDITGLLTTHGPGSFTGIRIGLAAAQGILAAQAMEISTITTLEATGFSAIKRGITEPFWVAFNAGKGEIYAQLFHVKQCQPVFAGDIQLISPDAFMAMIASDDRLAGNAATLLPMIDADRWIIDAHLPDAADFVYANAPLTRPEALVPLYIRAPDAKLPAVPLPLE